MLEQCVGFGRSRVLPCFASIHRYPRKLAPAYPIWSGVCRFVITFVPEQCPGDAECHLKDLTGATETTCAPRCGVAVGKNWLRGPATTFICSFWRGPYRSSRPPVQNRLVADIDAPLEQEILDLSQRQRIYIFTARRITRGDLGGKLNPLQLELGGVPPWRCASASPPNRR